MTENVASTVPRRHLGRILRELRLDAGVTLDAAAAALQCSRQKVWRIEVGDGASRGVDVRAMCELYAAPADLTAALVALARETRARGWWHAYDDPVPAWLDLYPGLEATARRLREHAGTLVPTLLQTPGYALALHEHTPELTDDDRERLVHALLRRQALLRRRLPPPPRLDVVLSEAVLLRVVGGPATMADQLRHLQEAARQPHIAVRVLPLAAGLPEGADAGAFVLLDFPAGKRTLPDASVVYQESRTGALYLDRPAELAAYERTWASLAALALDPAQSHHLIGKIAEEVHHG